jgi:hypothetical protein
MVGVGPAAADVDSAGVALVPLRQSALAAGLSPLPTPAPPNQDQPYQVTRDSNFLHNEKKKN